MGPNGLGAATRKFYARRLSMVRQHRADCFVTHIPSEVHFNSYIPIPPASNPIPSSNPHSSLTLLPSSFTSNYIDLYNTHTHTPPHTHLLYSAPLVRSIRLPTTHTTLLHIPPSCLRKSDGMAMPLSPAFGASDREYTSSLTASHAHSACDTPQHKLKPVRPVLRSRTESHVTTLRSLALNFADNKPNAIRQQRQRAVTSQCSAAHLREISELVKRMIDSEDQCSVSSMSLIPSTGTYRSRRHSNATSESVASSVSDLAAFTFEEDSAYASDQALAEDCMDEDDGCGDSNMDYHRTADWLAGRMARCSVGKEVRISKQRRTRGGVCNTDRR